MNTGSSTTPTGAASQDLPWILVVREVPEGGVSTHIHHGAYRTVDWAKQAAEQWEGPATPSRMTGENQPS